MAHFSYPKFIGSRRGLQTGIILLTGLGLSLSPALAQRPDKVPSAPPTTPEAAFEYHFDFRNSNEPDKNLKFQGPDPVSHTKREPEGLRMVYEADRDGAPLIEMGPNFLIRGDFDIIVGYEILDADKAAAELPAQFGSGFRLFLETHGLSFERFVFTHTIYAGGKNVYACSRRQQNAQRKQQDVPGIRLEEIPATERAGQIRMTRLGTKVTVATASPGTGKFRQLYQFDQDAEDVWKMWFGPYTRGAPNTAQVRFHDFHVLGAKSGPRVSLSWLAVLIAVALVIAGLWVWWRKERTVTLQTSQDA